MTLKAFQSLGWHDILVSIRTALLLVRVYLPCSCRLFPIGHAWFLAVVHIEDVQLAVLASTVRCHMFLSDIVL